MADEERLESKIPEILRPAYAEIVEHLQNEQDKLEKFKDSLNRLTKHKNYEDFLPQLFDNLPELLKTKKNEKKISTLRSAMIASNLEESKSGVETTGITDELIRIYSSVVYGNNDKLAEKLIYFNRELTLNGEDIVSKFLTKGYRIPKEKENLEERLKVVSDFVEKSKSHGDDGCSHAEVYLSEFDSDFLPFSDERLQRNLISLFIRDEYRSPYYEATNKLVELHDAGKLRNVSKLGVFIRKNYDSSKKDINESLNKLKGVISAVYLKHKDPNKFRKLVDLFDDYQKVGYIISVPNAHFAGRDSNGKIIYSMFSESDSEYMAKVPLDELAKIIKIPIEELKKGMGLDFFEDLKKGLEDEVIKEIIDCKFIDLKRPQSTYRLPENMLPEISQVDFRSLLNSEKYPAFKKLLEEFKSIKGPFKEKINLINKENSQDIIEELIWCIQDNSKKLKIEYLDKELENIYLRLAPEKFDEIRIESNDNFVDDIVDRTGACFSGPRGRHLYASYAYVLDPSMSLLSLNPYYEGKKLDSIGKAILVDTVDIEGKVLLVDGVIVGPDAEIMGLNFWEGGFLESIKKIADFKKIKRIVFNTSHNIKFTTQQCVHDFNRYIANEKGLDDIISKDFTFYENNYGVKEFKLTDKALKFEKDGFRYTHELYKCPMPIDRVEIMQTFFPDYWGEQYLDAWYPWNEHIAENYDKLGEETKKLPYVQERRTKYLEDKPFVEKKKKGHSYAWNLAMGPVKGIEIKLDEIRQIKG